MRTNLMPSQAFFSVFSLAAVIAFTAFSPTVPAAPTPADAVRAAHDSGHP